MKKMILVLLVASGFVDASQMSIGLTSTVSNDPIERAIRESFSKDPAVRFASIQSLNSHALHGRIVAQHFDRLLDIALTGIATTENTNVFNASFFLLQWLIEHGGIDDDSIEQVINVLLDGLLYCQNDNARWSYHILLSTLFKQKIVYEDKDFVDELFEFAIDKLTNEGLNETRGSRLLFDLLISSELINSSEQIDMVYNCINNKMKLHNTDIQVKSLQNFKSLVEQPLPLRPEIIQRISTLSNAGTYNRNELIKIVSYHLLQSLNVRRKKEAYKPVQYAAVAKHAVDQLATQVHRAASVDADAMVPDRLPKLATTIVVKTPSKFSSGAALGAPFITEKHTVVAAKTTKQQQDSSVVAKGLGQHVGGGALGAPYKAPSVAVKIPVKNNILSIQRPVEATDDVAGSEQ